jgi:hypothetical protein
MATVLRGEYRHSNYGKHRVKVAGGIFVAVQKHSFKRLGFCLVIACVMALCLSILFASGTVAYAVGKSMNAAPVAANNQDTPQSTPHADDLKTFHGMLTDSYCSARHSRYSNKSSVECARMCIRHGANYLLVNSENKFVLHGNKAELNHLAGQRVTIIGALNENSIGVHSIRGGD